MMCVPWETRNSSLHGQGVFAKEKILKDTLIWKFHPLIDHPITQAEFETLPKINQDYVAHYSYKGDGIYVFCGDDGRYFNHSDNPNTRGEESEDGYGETYAARDIEVGEELTSDYGEFDEDLDRKMTENPFV